MIRLIAHLLIVLGLSSSTLAQAENNPLPYEVFQNGWIVDVFENNHCMAGRRNVNGDYFFMSYDAVADVAALSVATRDLNHLQEGQRVGVHIILAINNKLDFSWGERDFKIIKDNNSMIVQGAFEPRDLFSDVARSDVIAFSLDGTAEGLIGSHKLDGSAVAIAALRRCAAELAGLR